MVPRELIEKIKIGLLVGGLIAVLIGYIFAVLKQKFKDLPAAHEAYLSTPIFRLGRYSLNAPRSFVACVLLLAAAGTLNYSCYTHLGKSVHLDQYDMLHYYVAPKYFDELSYFNLLPAILIADAEKSGPCTSTTRTYLHQTPQDYEVKEVAYALSLTDQIKSRFSPERWKSFVHDVYYLQRDLKPISCDLWRELVMDHGFNGTPTWILVARPIVSLIPVEYCRIASSLDIFWLVGALASVAWAFGLRTCAFTWLFLTVCYPMRWPAVGWSMLRYDWLSCIIIGISSLKKERYSLSGAFFAYAALMRYFPIVWMFGIGAKVVCALVTNREVPISKIWQRVPSRYFKVVIGFVATAVFFLSISIARDGISTQQLSFRKIFAHVQSHNLTSRRMGLAIVPSYRGEVDAKWITGPKKQLVADYQGVVRVVSIFALLWLGFAMSRLSDWEAVALGFLPFFWLTTASYYYYVVLASGVIIHAKSIHQTWHLFGILMLFFVQLVLYSFEYFLPQMRYPQISIACILLVFYSAGILGFLSLKCRKEAPLLA